jgi:hypothetical protein
VVLVSVAAQEYKDAVSSEVLAVALEVDWLELRLRVVQEQAVKATLAAMGLPQVMMVVVEAGALARPVLLLRETVAQVVPV